METLLEILREVQKGMVRREVCAYFFRKNVLEDRKTTLRRQNNGFRFGGEKGNKQ